VTSGTPTPGPIRGLVEIPPAMVDTESPSRTDSVASKDGTSIGYRHYGHGPGVILVSGAMGIAHNYDQLARAMASDFTVYVPDRRGRGMSPREYSTDHSIQRDVEDLDCLVARTGARFVFGLSSGALISLEAARVLPSIHKAALYEPPFLREAVPFQKIARFNYEVGQAKLAAALVTASRIVKLGPALARVMPRPLPELVAKIMLRRELNNAAGEYALLRELIPAMRYDFKVLRDRGGELESFKTVKTESLLLGGTNSPRYLKTALSDLASVLPHAHRAEFEGLDHSGPWNADQGGAPERIAPSLIHFFKG
jgi:pimeloyl-ACP methyl ester carboxylesterase